MVGPGDTLSKIILDALEAVVGAGMMRREPGGSREVVQVEGMDQVGTQVGWVGFGGSDLLISIDEVGWGGGQASGSLAGM